MKIELKKHTNKNVCDITNVCSDTTWSGTADSASRELSFNYLNAPYDSELNIPSVASGDIITFSDAGKELFHGLTYGTEKSSQIGTITYTAYDFMRQLTSSSGMHKFKNTTPEAIARKICSEAGVPIGSICSTGVNIKKMILEDTTFYDIILKAYKKARKVTGDKYYLEVRNRKFNVYKMDGIVENFILTDKGNIYESNIQESMDDLVNRVKIYDDKNNQIGEVKSGKSISTYGVFQKTYTKEKGVNPTKAAKTQLHTNPSQTITISAVGNINCISNRFVKLTDAATGLSGKYWIASDTHTWSNGVHTMELELKFHSKM